MKPVMLSPRGQAGLEAKAKIFSSASDLASKNFFGLGLEHLSSACLCEMSVMMELVMIVSLQ